DGRRGRVGAAGRGPAGPARGAGLAGGGDRRRPRRARLLDHPAAAGRAQRRLRSAQRTGIRRTRWRWSVSLRPAMLRLFWRLLEPIRRSERRRLPTETWVSRSKWWRLSVLR